MKTRRLYWSGLALAVLFVSVQCQFLSSLVNRQQQPVQNNSPANLPPAQDGVPLDQPPIDEPPVDLPPAQDGQPPIDNQAPAEIKLPGIWEAQIQTAYGIMYSQTALEYTGTFSMQTTLGDLLTYDVGTYTVGDGFIHFTVEKHEPQEYKGKPMQWLTSFTYFYTIVDANTMVWEDRVAGSSWTVHRHMP